MTLKDDLINLLQEEVIFLQRTGLNDEQLQQYRYQLKGDLSESRSV